MTLTDYPLTTDPTYPTVNTPFTLTVGRPACNCGLLTWDLPAVKTLTTSMMASPDATLVFDKATVNEASKSASADVVECYRDF